MPRIRPAPARVRCRRAPSRALAVAALFTAGAVTDLAPYLDQRRATVSGGTLASRTVPRMRPAEPPARAAGTARTAGSAGGAGVTSAARTPG